MKRVTGLGGVFFRCKDKQQMLKWYQRHLGIESEPYGMHAFGWREEKSPEDRGYTVWSPFAEDSEYFAPSERQYMLNYRVDDLVALLAALKDEGVELVGEMVQEPNGKFAWILDPEGNKIELWEPIDSKEDPYLPPLEEEPQEA